MEASGNKLNADILNKRTNCLGARSPRNHGNHRGINELRRLISRMDDRPNVDPEKVFLAEEAQVGKVRTLRSSQEKMAFPPLVSTIFPIVFGWPKWRSS